MNDTVTLALIAVGAPALMAVLTYLLQKWGKNADAEAARLLREEDRKALRDTADRAEAVSNRAAEDARKALLRQDASTAALEASTRAAAIARRETNAQLQALHTLGNSHTTALVRAELDSTRREVAALREIVALKSEAGHKPSTSALVVIDMADKRIAELEALMADRKLSDELAMAQIEEGQSAGKAADAAAIAAKPAAEEAARKIVPPVVTEVVPPVVKAAVKEALNEHDKAK